MLHVYADASEPSLILVRLKKKIAQVLHNPLRETVVCVQRSLASASGLGLQAVGWDHHEDKVRQVLLLPPVQVIQIQALVLLISVHALIIDTME